MEKTTVSKAKKIPNTNTVIKISQKREREQTKKDKPAQLEYVTKGRIIELCHELIDWAWKQTELPKEERDLVTIQTFLNEKRIFLSTFKRWCLENEELQFARNNAKAILGDMQLKLAASGKFNASPIMVILPMYNEEYKEGKQIEAELKAKAQTAQQTNVVVGIPTYQYDVIPASQQPGIPVDKAEEK